MKANTKRHRLPLLILMGICFVGAVFNHVRYLILWSNTVVLPNTADSTFDDAPILQDFRNMTSGFSSKKIHRSAASTTFFEKTDNIPSRAVLKSIPQQQATKSDPAPYFQDTICGGCRQILWARAKGRTCGESMNATAVRNQTSLVDALSIFMQENDKRAEVCKPCLPQSCSQAEKAYWRFDAAAPKILAAKTHYLPSVLEENRIPPNLMDLGLDHNTTFSRLEQYFSMKKRRGIYLFDYNPSIVQLPRSHAHLTKEYPTAVYLASYRLSNLQSCFPTHVSLAMIGGNWDDKPDVINLLGLALLDKDLNMIQDVVVKVPDAFVRWVDYRMFVFDEQLYLTSNCQMVPLWVNPNSTVAKLRFNREARNMTKSPLSVMWTSIPALCSNSLAEAAGAKNLNYFVDANGKHVVEFLPSSPRVLRHFDPTKHDIYNAPSPQNDYREKENVLPPPSFYTREELDLAEQKGFYGNALTSYRGSACCVSIEVPPAHRHRTNSSTLLMGIVHAKTPHGRKKLQGVVTSNQYLSRFYAFEPTPPYKMVANSGYFCLPANPTTTNDHPNNNPMAHIPTFSRLDIGKTLYDCPAIHFVTGMVDKADDPTRLIIGYGVQDCTSWFIEIDKREATNLLFAPPKRMGDSTSY